jgi:hypothetical protein
MPPVRHLTVEQARAALERGGGIEQLLGPSEADGQRTIRWLTVFGSRDGGFVVSSHYVFDDGFGDITEYTPVDADEGVGEGADLGRFASAQEAIVATSRLGASGTRWVNQGLVGDEWHDFRGT